VKKLLIVSPHFCPVNAPDMHRVRLALPHLRALGWEPTVLAVHPDSVEGGVRDPLLEKTYPPDIRVIRVRGISPHLTRRFRIGGLWLRCGRALRLAGERLLRSEKFHLVFFSTTQFAAFPLGPRWKRLFGVPYVLDYQDPWINDHYARTGQPPPGGRLKFALAQSFARRREPTVLRHAAGIISVSDAYGPSLAANHPDFDASRVLVLPFGASARDLEIARAHPPAAPLIPFGDGNLHLVYTGRGGDDMKTALTLLFRAFKRFLHERPAEAARVRFHFIGTSYAPPPLGTETILPVARAEGVSAHVHEHCARVPYFEALHYLSRADAILAIGSDDPGYSASKIFPCILARRPLLALFHRDSPIHGFMRDLGPGLSVPFGNDSDRDRALAHIADDWFLHGGMHRIPPFNHDAFAPFTAESMTRNLVTVFDAAPSSSP
jgi:glycosyltransferase involved in cell wall biosynthesis